jgi:hypothetical protein
LQSFLNNHTFTEENNRVQIILLNKHKLWIVNESYIIIANEECQKGKFCLVLGKIEFYFLLSFRFYFQDANRVHAFFCKAWKFYLTNHAKIFSKVFINIVLHSLNLKACA